MKKLLKEVWRSFSKSKIILGGLTLLVFLTSGIITLLFDVVSTYKRNYQTYQKISQRHDLTMNTNIEPRGAKPSPVYQPIGLPNLWKALEPANDFVESIRINTDQSYVDLNGLSTSSGQPLYVSTKDLNYLLNANLDRIKTDPTGRRVFTPDKTRINNLTLYEPQADGAHQVAYTRVDSLKTIYKATKNKIEVTNQIRDLLTPNGFAALLIDGANPENAYVANSAFFNSKTAIASAYQANPQRFFRIDNAQVAKWFGFVQTQSTYQFDKTLDLTLINPGLSPDELNQIHQPADLKHKSFNSPIILNHNNALGQGWVQIPQTIILDQSLVLPNSWFVYAQEVLTFTNHSYQLHDIRSEAWGKIYQDYFNTLDTKQMQQLAQTNFWTKKSTNNLVDGDGNLIKAGKELTVELTAADLVRPIVDCQSGKQSTIWQIQAHKTPRPPEDAAAWAAQLNQDHSKQLENQIEQGAKALAYQTIFQEIQALVKQIGLRENITISDTGGTQGAQVFQFINIGRTGQKFRWRGNEFEQEVGRLINSPDASQIYSLPSNIDNNVTQVPLNAVPKILDRLLAGLSLDRNYVNPMISFQNFQYTLEGKPQTHKQAKIIWLTPNGNSNRQQLVGLSAILNPTTGAKTFYLLRETHQKSNNWTAIQTFQSLDELSQYIWQHKLNFAPFDLNNQPLQIVGAKGWLQANANYSDQYFVPFQYYIPKPEILDEFSKFQTLNFFTNQLVLKLTETVKPLISATNFTILIDALNSGFARGGFGDALTPPANLSNQTIVNMVLFTLYDAVQATSQNFANLLVNDILNGIKRQVQAQGPDPIDQQQYLKQEFSKLAFVFNLTLGINPQLFISLIDSVEAPVQLLDGLIQIANSFDLDQTIINLHAIITDPARPRRQILASGDYIPALYLNLKNTKGVINGLRQIVASLNLAHLATIPGWAPIAKMLELLQPLLGFLDLEKAGIGYNRLLEARQLVKGQTYDVIYQQLDLAAILKLIKIPFLDIDKIIGGLDLPTLDSEYDPNYLNPLSLDLDLMWFVQNFVLTEPHNTFFGINAMEVLNVGANSISQVKSDQQQMIYEENAAKIALVNEAYLRANNKAIYQGRDLNQALDNLDAVEARYKINVANVEYLITGVNMTVDYLYPVLNNENLQVNPKTQALVYVNQAGYDRIRRSNINAPSESYFLLKDPQQNLSIAAVQTQLNRMAYQWINNNKPLGSHLNPNNPEQNPYQKAFLWNETNWINPERALRLTTIEQLLNVLTTVQKVVGIILALIIAIVIGFVVRRYIISRAKVIGILKAQGYTSMQIALSVCLFALAVSITGGALGYVAGHFSQLGVFNLLSLFWTMPITITTFNWLSFLLSIVVPFLFLSLLTIVITLWFLKKPPISLMNNSLEINDTRGAKLITNSLSRANIKQKFSISLALSSIGKLSALFIAVLMSAAITLFATTIFNVFNKAVNQTYAHRRFAYKTDLISPTIEGGQYANVELDPNPDGQKIDQMLYVPSGLPEEAYTYLEDYFKPGFNPIINVKLPLARDEQNNPIGWVDANGSVATDDQTTPHLFTKSALDLTVIAGGLAINIWENLYNTIPESQRATIINTSQKAAQWLEWTQEGHHHKFNNRDYISRFVNYGADKSTEEYLTLYDQQSQQNYQIWNAQTNNYEDLKLPYFQYIQDELNPAKSHFEWRAPHANKYINNQIIINGEIENNIIRMFYRNFLVQGYQKMLNYPVKTVSLLPSAAPEPAFALDYFIMAGANAFDHHGSQADESYTYIDATSPDGTQRQRIYGYQSASQHVSIRDSNGANLLQIAEHHYKTNQIFPLIINKVVQQKHGLKVGQWLKFSIDNHFRRNQIRLAAALQSKGEQIVGAGPEVEAAKPGVKMQIVGISNTYINEEWITTQTAANAILGLPGGYNGIFTASEVPVQLANSLALYAPSGYWSAQESINTAPPNALTPSQIEENANIYKRLFYNVAPGSAYDDHLENHALVAQHVKTLLQTYTNQPPTNQTINQALKVILGFQPEASLDVSANANQVYEALNRFSTIYSNKALQAAFVNATSNGIEREFVLKTATAINQGLTIVMSLALVIAVTILVMISVMIINENERSIAIFAILGYSTPEKLQMFFAIYVPIVTVAIALAILLVWAFLPVFSLTILQTAAIALPIRLTITSIITTAIAISSIFTLTCLGAWWLQGRIKPVMLLKGV